MRLKDQHATAYLAGPVDAAVLAALWRTVASHGVVTAETRSWDLDDPDELTDDMVNNTEIHVALSNHGGRLHLRVWDPQIVTVSGGTDARVHALVAELVGVAAGLGLSAHETWGDARRALAATEDRFGRFPSTAVRAGWATVATGGVVAVVLATMSSVPFGTALLIADAAGVAVFWSVRRRLRTTA